MDAKETEAGTDWLVDADVETIRLIAAETVSWARRWGRFLQWEESERISRGDHAEGHDAARAQEDPGSPRPQDRPDATPHYTPQESAAMEAIAEVVEDLIAHDFLVMKPPSSPRKLYKATLAAMRDSRYALTVALKTHPQAPVWEKRTLLAAAEGQIRRTNACLFRRALLRLSEYGAARAAERREERRLQIAQCWWGRLLLRIIGVSASRVPQGPLPDRTPGVWPTLPAPPATLRYHDQPAETS